jgi:hypothetical protein
MVAGSVFDSALNLLTFGIPVSSLLQLTLLALTVNRSGDYGSFGMRHDMHPMWWLPQSSFSLQTLVSHRTRPLICSW